MNDNDLKNLSTTEIEEFIEWFKMESNKMSLTIYMLDTILTQYVMKDIVLGKVSYVCRNDP